jgi:hypothetical protein
MLPARVRTLHAPSNLEAISWSRWIARRRNFATSFAALVTLTPHLRPGAIVVCDNTESSRADYADYFGLINDPSCGFRTITLPFTGGFELSVWS